MYRQPPDTKRYDVMLDVSSLDTDLFDRDCGLPRFLLVQNGKADCAGWVDVGMEERWIKFT